MPLLAKKVHAIDNDTATQETACSRWWCKMKTSRLMVEATSRCRDCHIIYIILIHILNILFLIVLDIGSGPRCRIILLVLLATRGLYEVQVISLGWIIDGINVTVTVNEVLLEKGLVTEYLMTQVALDALHMNLCVPT
jgi:hypothetical protein